MCLQIFLGSAKMPLEQFRGHFSMQFVILNTFLQVKISLKCIQRPEMEVPLKVHFGRIASSNSPYLYIPTRTLITLCSVECHILLITGRKKQTNLVTLVHLYKSGPIGIY